MEPEGFISPSQVYLGSNGLATLHPSEHRNENALAVMYNITKRKGRSIYAETWSNLFETAHNETLQLKATIDNTELATDSLNRRNQPTLNDQLKQIAKLIKSSGELGQDRQAFFVEVGGFDTHSDNGGVLKQKFAEINDALEAFHEEMVAQGVWDDVLIVETSDFARTITSNGAGTDHGWGGHYLMLGGGLKGSTILGVYPDDLTPNGDLNIGRGRFIPSLGWEAVWNAISKWYGVPASQMERVMPLLGRFGKKDLFDPSDFFRDGSFINDKDPDSSIVAYAVLGVASFLLLAMLGGMVFLVHNRRGEIKRTARKLSAILDAPVRVESTRVGNRYNQTSNGHENYFNKQNDDM